MVRVRKEMNTIQKIIKTFFLTLFVSIVCICSTVFAASEPIGSINYPAPLKVGDDGLSYTYKGYHSSSGKVTKNLYLKLLELKIGEEAETYVKNKNSYCASSTSTSCWYLFKIRLYYFSSSETTPTDIEPYDIIDENSFYNAQKTQLKQPNISGLCKYTENYMKSIYPNSSTDSNYVDFYYGILLDNCTPNDYPIIKFDNDYELKNLLYVSTNPNYTVGSDITKAKVYGLKHKTYTGKAHGQSLIVKYGSTTLKKDIDYKLSYKNNIKVGEAIVRIIGIGKYAGVLEKYFFIAPAAPKKLMVSEQTYKAIQLKWTNDSKANGYMIYMYKPSTKKWVKVKTVYNNSATISTDAYKNKLIPCYGYKFRVAPFIRKTSSASGKTVDVFTAYKSITGYTRPLAVKITKFSLPARGTMALTWAKSSRVSGYMVIVYKGYNVDKIIRTYYTKKNSMKITRLASNECYYVGVLPYKTINGEKLFSDNYYYYYAQIK